jgi:hypothetical protein
MDPITKLKNLEERARQRSRERQTPVAEAKKQEPTPTLAKVVRLPVETEEHRATPNICLRSALFGVVERGTRRWLRDAVIAAQDGYQVIYTGEQLDQSDLDIWLAVKHLCSHHPLGTEVEFSAPQLFRMLGKPDGQASREALKRSLKRMYESAVGMLAPSGSGFAGHMIDWWTWDERAYRFRVILSPKMAPLFRDEEYTLLAIEQRQKLSKELSRWLHGYWSSHKRIYPIYDSTLMALCGAQFGLVSDFRKDLREALAELEAAGLIAPGWMVDRKGLVTATKTPTVKALQRALRKTRKAVKKQNG